MLDIVTHALRIIAGAVKIDGFLGLPARHPSLFGELQANEIPVSKNKNSS